MLGRPLLLCLVALRNLDRNEEALEAADKAIQLDPEDSDAWMERAVVLADLEWTDEALAAFTQKRPSLTRLTPGHGRGARTFLTTLAGTRRRLRRPTKRSSSSLPHPEDADAWMQRGFALSTLERAEEALQAFTKATEL